MSENTNRIKRDIPPPPPKKVVNRAALVREMAIGDCLECESFQEARAFANALYYQGFRAVVRKQENGQYLVWKQLI